MLLQEIGRLTKLYTGHVHVLRSKECIERYTCSLCVMHMVFMY